MFATPVSEVMGFVWKSLYKTHKLRPNSISNQKLAKATSKNSEKSNLAVFITDFVKMIYFSMLDRKLGCRKGTGNIIIKGAQ